MTKILRIDSSARYGDSASRELAGRLIDRLTADGDATVSARDLGEGVPQISEATLGAVFTPPEARSAEQVEELALGDELIEELVAADVLVFGLPIYNFGPPASLKAWADLVARAGVTFRYTETGPQGLVADKPAYIVYTAGGVPAGSPMDFSSTWLTTFLGFLGITDVTVVAAEGLNVHPIEALDAGRAKIDAVALPASV